MQANPQSAHTLWRVRLEKERRGRRDQARQSLESTRFDPVRYIREKLGWEPWDGDNDHPGQQQILDAYALALRQQHEKRDYEAGGLDESSLTCWKPGEAIKNIIRIEAGHTTGKTKVASGLVSHFYDHFCPSVVYTYAPTWEQISDLLWKEIKADRRAARLPGRVLETCEIKDDQHANHFAKGRATNNVNNQGTERVQGQHEQYQMFVLDEAEGVADYVFDAIKSMTSGGISIVLMLANPRTRTSRFHKIRSHANVANFRMSCLHHPNVMAGREVVPSAVRRDYVLSMIEDHCRVVESHDSDAFTFELSWSPGVIYEPDPEMMFRVLGIAPTNVSDKNLIPVGRFEAATKRQPSEQRPRDAWIGVDVARFGRDFGTVYIRWNGRVWCAGKLAKLDTVEYAQFIQRESLKMKQKGVNRLHIRVDGGGGFGGGVIDNLKRDDLIIRAFAEFKTFEVQFGSSPKDGKQYYDWITEATADVAESLKTLAIEKPPNELQEDLCEREYDYRNVASDSVKKLEEKLQFRKRVGRSPDDGDGFVLACVSEFLVESGVIKQWNLQR